ncbi:type B 50S ribosomal protein L31 [Xylanimonas protaetiae]|uniref:50S ribosomal protein L31 n=1 Tax=Xylanimonas protaetiae TaxID=2509457 RepID=A0A4P6FB42_9MICO|nr:type B 50S ribosomal protein L31 [Xylanimonas protaetiae]QAY71509.1 50S ribosomal protein L31 [Xylanimonas protaetiae]
MRKDIHPAYGPVVFRDRSTGTTFATRSTLGGRGGDVPVVDVEISAASHPFWTGGTRVVDTAGRVEKFRRRYGTR